MIASDEAQGGPEEEIISFGHWLKLRRRTLRLTQRMLAGRVYCSSELIRKIEADARRPSPLLAERLAEHLGLAPQHRATFCTVARGLLAVAALPAPSQVPGWLDPAAAVVGQHALPVPATPLIGRDAEVAELGALLQHRRCRLISIVGPGGIGKTRLALAAATDQAPRFVHGAVFVPLTALNSARFLAPTILAALDGAPQGQRDPWAALLAYLREKDLLLVLDNVEHLLAPHGADSNGGMTLLTDLLQHAPGVTLLITSRHRLAVHGEWLFDLAGLTYPLDRPAEGVEGYPAVQLFVQCARQVRRQFTLTPSDMPAVVRICQLVEGLPLAIELAAGAVRSRACPAIAAAIEASLAALATDLRGIPERHRSMWITLEYSWCLLPQDEQQGLARLSVFRGGFDEGAAAQVAHASVQILAALVDKSLLRWDGVARYGLHELVRQYASEKLRERAEDVPIRDQHLRYFRNLAQQAELELLTSASIAYIERLNMVGWRHAKTAYERTNGLAGRAPPPRLGTAPARLEAEGHRRGTRGNPRRGQPMAQTWPRGRPGRSPAPDRSRLRPTIE